MPNHSHIKIMNFQNDTTHPNMLWTTVISNTSPDKSLNFCFCFSVHAFYRLFVQAHFIFLMLLSPSESWCFYFKVTLNYILPAKCSIFLFQALSLKSYSMLVCTKINLFKGKICLPMINKRAGRIRHQHMTETCSRS